MLYQTFFIANMNGVVTIIKTDEFSNFKAQKNMKILGKVGLIIWHANRRRLLLRTPGPVQLWDLRVF